MQKINVKFIYPDNEEDLKALQERIDTIHADMIIESLNRMPISYEDKVKILDEVINFIKLEGNIE